MNRTVLVLRFSAVGDVVLTAPAIAALRAAWPDARIVYAIKERLAHLVEHNPHVDQVIALRNGEGPLSYARRLRETRPTAVLDLHGKIRSRILRALLPGVQPRVNSGIAPWRSSRSRAECARRIRRARSITGAGACKPVSLSAPG